MSENLDLIGQGFYILFSPTGSTVLRERSLLYEGLIDKTILYKVAKEIWRNEIVREGLEEAHAQV